MENANQKSTVDTHTHKSKQNTTLNIVIKSKENKEEGKKKNLQKQIQNN